MKRAKKRVGTPKVVSGKDDRALAIKETVVRQLKQAMEEENITKVEMARRMKTSRAALDRLLDSGRGAVTLQTLLRAAKAIGRRLRVELVQMVE